MLQCFSVSRFLGLVPPVTSLSFYQGLKNTQKFWISRGGKSCFKNVHLKWSADTFSIASISGVFCYWGPYFFFFFLLPLPFAYKRVTCHGHVALRWLLHNFPLISYTFCIGVHLQRYWKCHSPPFGRMLACFPPQSSPSLHFLHMLFAGRNASCFCTWHWDSEPAGKGS